MSGSPFKCVSLVAARASGLTLVGDTGLWLDPDGLIVSSDSVSTSWGAALNANAAPGTLLGTAQVFAIVAPETIQGWFSAQIRIPWTVTAAAGAGAPTAQIRATLLGNGVVIATRDGAARGVQAGTAGTQYTEIIQIDPGAPYQLSRGQALSIQFQPRLVVAAGGVATFEPTLRHDPGTPADQLALDLVGMAAGN